VKKYVVDLSKEEAEQLRALTHEGACGAQAPKGTDTARGRRGAHRRTDSPGPGHRGEDGRAGEEALRGGGPQAAISERPRPGKAPKLDGRQEAYLVALACSSPPEEAASERWSMRLLAERLVELEVVDEISEETVRRTLKKGTSNRG
jgi:hypothetical protein